LCPFEKLDFSWKVLSDEVRRNTMVITTHDDVKKNPEIAKRLEQQGIAQLSLSRVEEQEILKTLARYKFISVLLKFRCQQKSHRTEHCDKLLLHHHHFQEDRRAS